jgi:glycosyltransferase involved in cell wall biosynthesis
VPEIVFAVPGDLATPTGGYAYARRMLDLLPQEGIAIHHLALPAGYPNPSPADVDETARLIAATPDNAVLLIDGLAYGAMPISLIAGFKRPIVALVHHPLGLESGLSDQRRAALLASERAALAFAERVIVTSPLTARVLVADFGVPSARIAIAEPGTDPAARASGTGAPVQLLSVGAVSPRKGYDGLILALKDLADLSWQATIAGATDRMPETSAALARLIDGTGLSERVTLAGAINDEALEALYAKADVFVSPSLYEGYGMVLAEAMARGLPLVASTGGAAAETASDSVGIKVPPGDVDALRDALRLMILDASLRARCAQTSWAAGQKLPRWSDTVQCIAAVLKETTR